MKSIGRSATISAADSEGRSKARGRGWCFGAEHQRAARASSGGETEREVEVHPRRTMLRIRSGLPKRAAVSDPALAQIVRRQGHRHGVAGQDADEVFPDLARDVRDDLVAVFQPD